MKVTESTPDIMVDRRPMVLVILDRLRREILLVLFFSTFFFLISLEGPVDLSREGYKVLCVFFLCVSLWTTNLIPLSITQPARNRHDSDDGDHECLRGVFLFWQ